MTIINWPVVSLSESSSSEILARSCELERFRPEIPRAIVRARPVETIRSHARVPLYPTYCVTSFLHFRSFSLQRVPITLSILLFPAEPFLFFPSVFLRSVCFLLFSLSSSHSVSFRLYTTSIFFFFLISFLRASSPVFFFFSSSSSSSRRIGFCIFVRDTYIFEPVPRGILNTRLVAEIPNSLPVCCVWLSLAAIAAKDVATHRFFARIVRPGFPRINHRASD